MQYFDLPKIDKSLLEKLKLTNLFYVDVTPDKGATQRNCLNNVRAFLEKNEGEVQLGWIFACMGNIAVKMTAHAVVKLSDKSLLCVTPNEFRKGKLKFSPDDSIQDLIKNDFLPTRFVPLIESEALNQYLALEREMDDLRLSNNGIISLQEQQQIHMRASLLYPSILAVAKAHTNRNDYCFCGSGIKRKKCCN